MVLLLEALLVACRKAVSAANPILLEPRMDFEVECPAASLSAVLADLNGRHAEIRDVQALAEHAFVRGMVRLSAMLGYTTRLRSITRGLATANLQIRDLVLVADPPDDGGQAREKELRNLDRS